MPLLIPVFFCMAIGSSCVVLAQQADKQNSQFDVSHTANSGATQKAPEMEKLAKILVGSWNVFATLEPSAAKPKGRKDIGANRIVLGPVVLGPGGRSVVENYHTEGDSGSRVALGILWWDEQAHGYRTMFCDNADPAGCSVHDGLGNWEGPDLIFHFRRDRDGNRIEGKEVISSTSPFSFTVRYFESRNGGPEDPTWTVNNTKTE
jgi:hypothetical protein